MLSSRSSISRSALAKLTAASPVSYHSSVTAVHPIDYSHNGLYACSEAFEDQDCDSGNHGVGNSQYETQVRTGCI